MVKDKCNSRIDGIMKKYIKTLIFCLGAVLCFQTVPSCSAQDDDWDDSEEPWIWNGGKGGKTDGESFYPKAEGSFRIVTYNVGAFCKVLTSVNENVKLVASMLNEVEADAVCLNELDSLNTRNNVNEVALLADALGGWKWYFGRAMAFRGGAYGNGVVVPKGTDIIDSYTVALPEGSEPRSIAVVETEKYVLASAHLEVSADGVRTDQVTAVNEWADEKYRNCAKPVFFCGDMNSVPTSEAIAILETKWERLSSTESTVLPLDTKKCIDYIFHYRSSAAVTVVGTHSMTRFSSGDVTKASDHLPVYVDVKF